MESKEEPRALNAVNSEAKIGSNNSAYNTPNKKKKSKRPASAQRGTVSSSASVRDDATQGTTSSQMLEIKNGRKRAEQDMQLLLNRIALLKAEEERTKGKVDETKTRAQDILDLKKRNEDKLKEKEKRSEEREKQIKEIRDKANRDKDTRKEKLRREKERLEKSRRDAAITLQSDGNKVVEESKRIKKKIEDENRAKAQKGRERLLEQRKARELEQTKRDERTRKEYAERQEEEQRKSKETEKIIQKLEKEEREMMARLKKTQDLQHQAYQVLQASLES